MRQIGALATSVEFLSTPSARRATGCDWLEIIDDVISIHALREEGDRRSGACWLTPAYFYPRPPRGGRLTRYSLSPR